MKDIIFLHIPKTGGTTIMDTLGITTTKNAQRFDYMPLKSGRYAFGHGRYIDLLGRQMVTREYLDNAFLFSFVRNPYDQVVSHYAFCCQYRKWGMDLHTSFAEFLERIVPKQSNFWPQTVFIEDAPLDYLGRYENFEDDLRTVGWATGTEIGEVPRLNPSVRPHYKEMYTPETKEMVERFYADDFDYLGYDFESW